MYSVLKTQTYFLWFYNLYSKRKSKLVHMKQDLVLMVLYKNRTEDVVQHSALDELIQNQACIKIRPSMIWKVEYPFCMAFFR